MKKLLQHPFFAGFFRAIDLTGGTPTRRITAEDIAGPEADRQAFSRDRAAMGRDLRKAARQAEVTFR